MAPHGFEIEDDEALLGLGLGEELRTPALPSEFGFLAGRTDRRSKGAHQEREGK
jgi:hypothetical protein